MTAEKKPRGRPPKVAPEPVPKNPDQKLATRGYVKCLARKVQSHRHVNNMSEGIGWSAVSLFVCGLAMLAVTAILWDGHMSAANLVLIAVGWSIVANSIIMLCIFWAIDRDSTTLPEEKPEEIAAYTPPKERSKYDQDRYCGED